MSKKPTLNLLHKNVFDVPLEVLRYEEDSFIIETVGGDILSVLLFIDCGPVGLYLDPKTDNIYHHHDCDEVCGWMEGDWGPLVDIGDFGDF